MNQAKSKLASFLILLMKLFVFIPTAALLKMA
jgi:hypothetical protein